MGKSTRKHQTSLNYYVAFYSEFNFLFKVKISFKTCYLTCFKSEL